MTTQIIFEEGDLLDSLPNSVFVQVRRHASADGLFVDNVIEWRVRLNNEIAEQGKELFDVTKPKAGIAEAAEIRIGIEKFDELKSKHLGWMED